MTTRRHIDYTFSHSGDIFTVKIIEQTHRGREFSELEGGNTFFVKGLFGVLRSDGYPAACGIGFHLCGYEKKKDNMPLRMTTKRFHDFERLVAAYNKTYKGDETMETAKTKTLRERIEELQTMFKDDGTNLHGLIGKILDRTVDESTARPGGHLREALERIADTSTPESTWGIICRDALAVLDPEPDPHEGERDLATHPPEEGQRIFYFAEIGHWLSGPYHPASLHLQTGTWREQPPPPVPPFEPKHLTLESFYGEVQAITQITVDRFDTLGISDITLQDLATMRDYCIERLKEAGR